MSQCNTIKAQSHCLIKNRKKFLTGSFPEADWHSHDKKTKICLYILGKVNYRVAILLNLCIRIAMNMEYLTWKSILNRKRRWQYFKRQSFSIYVFKYNSTFYIWKIEVNFPKIAYENWNTFVKTKMDKIFLVGGVIV